MERFYEISFNRLKQTPTKFKRYLLDEIHWNDRLIGISGARGCGKTTLMLQYMKSLPQDTEALYISLDDVYFSTNRLVYFAEDFYKKGGEYLFIDEVHKYENWSQELKNIYDNLPDLKIVFTSSSALDIYKGTHDLSRRVLVYHLPGLSFREFIHFRYDIYFPAISLEEVINHQPGDTWKYLGKFKPLKIFPEYLKYGYYPFFIESIETYSERLLTTINLVMETDLPPVYHLDYYSVQKIKSILSVISRIVPFKPNIKKLTEQVGTTRDTLLKYLFYLEKAQLLKRLTTTAKGINYMNKPDKLYLNNTNLMYALAGNHPDTGNLRETFFLNQLSVNHQVYYPDTGDFLVDEKYLFEVGGKNKTIKQIAGIDNAYIAADDIEYRVGSKIPLWLFGFLY